MNINDSTVLRSFTHLAMFKVILVMLNLKACNEKNDEAIRPYQIIWYYCINYALIMDHKNKAGVPDCVA